MKNADTPSHVRGTTLFVDDLPEPAGCLYAHVCASPTACGALGPIDVAAATGSEGIRAVLTARDIPGANQIGGIFPDETLLAEGHVQFVGEPVALVVGETASQARRAADLVRFEVVEESPVFDPRVAAKNGSFVAPPRTLALGDTNGAWADCAVIVDGTAESGGQEHLYLETQASIAIPLERGRLRIYSSTQSPTAVQGAVARILDVPMNHVEVEVQHLGGAFGGKEDQATPWACLTALAAAKLNRPVKLVLRRHDDMRLTGKRHPYSSDFKIGLDSGGKILAYEATYYQNSGAVADLSSAIMERSLFHATNSYYVPNVRVTGMCCKTNLPPFTAFRGFGGPQAMFVMEAAIQRAADALGVDASEIQRKNLLSENDRFPYGMSVERCHARRSVAAAWDTYSFDRLRQMVSDYNAENHLTKRGVSVMPICFGISFTKTMLNQAGALIHVYTDGSVAVSTGVIEMGQGVNTKIRSVVAKTLGVPVERIIIEHTNTTRVANTSPTAASSGADLNGMAAHLAGVELRERLTRVASRLLDVEPASLRICDGIVCTEGGPTDLDWSSLVSEAYCARTNLTSQAYYATPDLYYDMEKEQGKPFAYHVFGCAITTVTVDVLRGTFDVDAVRIIHDAGTSLNPLIDRGQVDGALLQGIGWMTMEEVIYNDRGELVTSELATYKVPDLHAMPDTVAVHFLEDAENPHAVMYGIGTYFAVMHALRQQRPDKEAVFSAPITHEKVLRFLYDE